MRVVNEGMMNVGGHTFGVSSDNLTAVVSVLNTIITAEV